MRLVRYQAAGGTGIGAVRPDGSVVTTPWPDFGVLFAEPDPLRAAQSLDLSCQEPVAVQRLLAPAVDRAQVSGTGGNYADHPAEARTGGLVVAEPVFMPYLWGAVIGPEDDIVIPAGSLGSQQPIGTEGTSRLIGQRDGDQAGVQRRPGPSQWKARPAHRARTADYRSVESWHFPHLGSSRCGRRDKSMTGRA